MIWVVLWWLGRVLPITVSRWLLSALCPVLVRVNAVDTTALRRNLAAVRPDLDAAALDELVLENVRSYTRYWTEVFELSGRRRGRALERVVVHRERLLRDSLSAGRGVIVALPHMANWDLAGAWVSQTVPTTTVAERIRPALLFRMFSRLRAALGMTVVPLDGGRAMAALRQALDGGGVVALVADRVVGEGPGVDVRFKSGRSTLPAGPALLAYQSGAPLVPVSLFYEGPAMHIEFCPPIAVDRGMPRKEAVAAATQDLASVFADAVATHPADWRALQPVVAVDA